MVAAALAPALGAVGSIVGGTAVALGAAGKGGERDIKKALAAWQQLELSNFDFRSLSAPQLRLIGEYFPEAYDAVVPEEFKVIDIAPTYQAERTALSQLQDVAETGEADIDRIQRLEIEDYLSGVQGRGQEDILRDLARRGQGGGGDVLRARLTGSQQASQQASQLGRGAIADRAGRRFEAIRDVGAQAGAMSGRNLQREAANQQAQTAYNSLFANLKTDAARFGAEERGFAQATNLGRAQYVGDANALNRYEQQLADLERQNQLRSMSFGERATQTSGIAGGYLNKAASADRTRNAKAAALVGTGRGLGQAGGGLYDWYQQK